MIVYYRMCGIPSTNPSPILQEDKFELNKLCLESFLKAFKDVDIEVVYILDHCDERYKVFLNLADSRKKEVIETNIGINDTCLLQYQLAREQDDDILFQECDYIYRPDTGKDLVAGVEELGLVSPYDHPNFYRDRELHSPTTNLTLVNNTHWRSSERNTMTFAVRNDIFKQNYDIFRKHGYLDGQVWYDLLDNGQSLFTPIPSLATHMVADYMAPSVDWKSIYEPES